MIKAAPFTLYNSIFNLYTRKSGKWEDLIASITSAKLLLQLLYAVTASLLFLNLLEAERAQGFPFFPILLIILASFVCDFSMRLIASLNPQLFFRSTSFFSTLYLCLTAPLNLTTLKALRYLFFKISKPSKETMELREKLIEILEEMPSELDAEEKKLILAVASFTEKIARNVMIPRINLFRLPATISIKEACQKLAEEGYSRVPVYKDSPDQIIGIIFLKDIFKLITSNMASGAPLTLTDSIEAHIKPITFSPETQPISKLLQEFRKSRQHMAAVVNEYGEFEGIVTIEDIIEELFGEIADEYDEPVPRLYKAVSNNSYEVDARMSIQELNQELPFSIPSHPSYDTIGGFVFQKAGIPKVGFTIMAQTFTLTVLESDAKNIKKILLSPPLEEELH